MGATSSVGGAVGGVLGAGFHGVGTGEQLIGAATLGVRPALIANGCRIIEVGLLVVQQRLMFVARALSVINDILRRRAARSRDGVRFTRDFENLVVWLATKTDKTATCRLTRIDWETISRIIERVGRELIDGDWPGDLFEISIEQCPAARSRRSTAPQSAVAAAMRSQRMTRSEALM